MSLQGAGQAGPDSDPRHTMPPLWCGADASGGRPAGSPAGPAGLAPGRLDEHFRLSFEGGV
jgi:hypothetical protein